MPSSLKETTTILQYNYVVPRILLGSMKKRGFVTTKQPHDHTVALRIRIGSKPTTWLQNQNVRRPIKLFIKSKTKIPYQKITPRPQRDLTVTTGLYKQNQDLQYLCGSTTTCFPNILHGAAKIKLLAEFMSYNSDRRGPRRCKNLIQ